MSKRCRPAELRICNQRASERRAETPEDAPIIAPPSTLIVDFREREVVLYTADGKPLMKRPAGFRT